MLRTVLDGLARMPGHDVSVLHDYRLRAEAFPGNTHVAVRPGWARELFDVHLAEADAAVVIAPETGGLLRELTAAIEHRSRLVLGSSSRAVGVAGDKIQTYHALHRAGVPVPRTRTVVHGRDPRRTAAGLGMPVVVKPATGAGGEGSILVRRVEDLAAAIARAKASAEGDGGCVVQEYVEGVSASVSLVTDGLHYRVLSLNRQTIEVSLGFRYAGGEVPFDHPWRDTVCAVAEAACRAIPGLRGYVGVDLMLRAQGPVVLEVNPRWTVSAWALQRAVAVNLMEVAVDAVLGRRMPTQVEFARRVTFSIEDLIEVFHKATGVAEAALGPHSV
jgi:predicted ATP-grasp superfamily ATP-dependent carboligase